MSTTCMCYIKACSAVVRQFIKPQSLNKLSCQTWFEHNSKSKRFIYLHIEKLKLIIQSDQVWPDKRSFELGIQDTKPSSNTNVKLLKTFKSSLNNAVAVTEVSSVTSFRFQVPEMGHELWNNNWVSPNSTKTLKVNIPARNIIRNHIVIELF